MKRKNILIVPKFSKYEHDLHTLKITPNELMTKYTVEGVDIPKIMHSHERQQRALQELKERFPAECFISRHALTKELAEEVSAVISFGGDNHFQYVSHFLMKTPIIGINSDPTSSEGVLTFYTPRDYHTLVDALEQEQYTIEQWPRLQLYVNGKLTQHLATAEFFIGEYGRPDMSRYFLRVHGKKEEQKSSGIIISTGVGSTGWYNSACRYLYPDGNTFEKTQRLARFLVTEPYKGKLNGSKLLDGELKPKQHLRVTSIHNNNGVIIVDSLEQLAFPRGTQATVSISNKPLQVLRIRDSR